MAAKTKKAGAPAPEAEDEPLIAQADEEVLKEFALDEGITEDEALAEMEEIAADEGDDLIDVEDGGAEE